MERNEQEQVCVKKTSKSLNRGCGGFLRGFITGVFVMVVAVVVIGVLIPGVKGSLNISDNILDRNTQEKIEVLADYISNYYYEEVDVETLQEGLYRGLFDNLDVYSQYYSPEEYNTLSESLLEGAYCGIGASLQQDPDTMQVSIMHVYDESPAKEAGLQEGDIIFSADEYMANTMELTELITHIRGEEGTSVHLVIYRNGKSMEFDIQRKKMQFPTVDSEMLENKTGYIIVSEFTETTTAQFQKALDQLNEKGMQSLIIDLRGNPGGLLPTVCDMLDQILPKGLLVYTEDRAGNRKEFESSDKTSLSIPLVVLVDENSASASEIFAGAIQDRQAGTIVGTTTFGKGVVQEMRSFKDGSAFKLTNSRYFTPSGTCIQGIGITPDVEVEYEFLGGENDLYEYQFDNQIQKALEILNNN